MIKAVCMFFVALMVFGNVVFAMDKGGSLILSDNCNVITCSQEGDPGDY